LFNYHEDGSLRNNGREYVSVPVKAKYLEVLLTDFFKSCQITDRNYSDRTSTHIHVNVQDYTQDQLAALAMIYQVFERLLLNFVGEERANNIFCVPWCQANITTNLAQVIKSGNYRNLRQWSKYTALNLLAVTQKGTVEYRHLYGTCDVKVILTWVNIISSMHEYARVNKLEDIEKMIVDLNTSSAYEAFLHSVFTQWTDPLKIEGYQQAMEQGVIDVKLMLTDENGLLRREAPVAAEWPNPGWGNAEIQQLIQAEQARIREMQDRNALARSRPRREAGVAPVAAEAPLRTSRFDRILAQAPATPAPAMLGNVRFADITLDRQVVVDEDTDF
jgi:hypothetical protein